MTETVLRSSDNSSDPQVPPAGVKLTFLVREHEYLSNAIAFADQKAAFIFAVAGGAMTLGANMHQYDSVAGQPWLWIQSHRIAAAGVVCILLAAALSLATLFPRLRSKGNPGVVFWLDVLSYRCNAGYSRQILSLEDLEIVDGVARHCYALAGIAKAKFSLIKRALWIGAAGGMLTMIALVFTVPDKSADLQTALRATDRAAAAVLAGIEIDLPAQQMAERAVGLGTEIHASRAALPVESRKTLAEFERGYHAAAQLLSVQRSLPPTGVLTATQTSALLRHRLDAVHLLQVAETEFERSTGGR